VTSEIRLSIPHRPPFHGVALLVVGGLAARLDLSYEHLEDLQLALESILDNGDYALDRDVSVELDIDDGSLAMLVGPLAGDALRSDLEDDDDDERLSLGRLLRTLVQHVSVEERDGAAWLRLEKEVGAVHAGEAEDHV
jgi:anti-sigma regulatory factor (Ser/Thr protein kinase)